MIFRRRLIKRVDRMNARMEHTRPLASVDYSGEDDGPRAYRAAVVTIANLGLRDKRLRILFPTLFMSFFIRRNRVTR